METTDIERLIAYKLMGKQLSDEEEQRLQQWMDESALHRQSYEEIKNEAFDAEAYRRYAQIDEEKAWRNFLEATAPQRPSLLQRVMKYAVAFSIPLLVSGLAVYFYLSPTDGKEKEVAAAVVPGATGAVLQTAGGNTVSLNEATLQENHCVSADTNMTATRKGIVMRMPQPDPSRTTEEDDRTPHVLKTLRNGEFQITLEDGTLVHLNYNTTLRFPRHFSKKERLVYLQGEAFFQVAKDSVRPFKVMTDEMMVKQYGTSFNVNTYSPTQTEVVLVEGSIGVLSNAKEYAMQPSDRLIFDKQTTEIEIEATDVTPYIAWHEGRFIFDNESLNHIMNTLSHWYDVEVVFDNPAWKELHFTGNMNRYGNLGPILKAISQTVGLHMELKNRVIYISEKHPAHESSKE